GADDALRVRAVGERRDRAQHRVGVAHDHGHAAFAQVVVAEQRLGGDLGAAACDVAEGDGEGGDAHGVTSWWEQYDLRVARTSTTVRGVPKPPAFVTTTVPSAGPPTSRPTGTPSATDP